MCVYALCAQCVPSLLMSHVILVTYLQGRRRQTTCYFWLCLWEENWGEEMTSHTKASCLLCIFPYMSALVLNFSMSLIYMLLTYGRRENSLPSTTGRRNTILASEEVCEGSLMRNVSPKLWEGMEGRYMHFLSQGRENPCGRRKENMNSEKGKGLNGRRRDICGMAAKY